MGSKKIVWIIWLLVTLGIGSYYGYMMFVAEDKSGFLIGETTHGHFQIEMACTACHTDAFGGPEVIQDACVGCHAAELEEADDSHPRKKFTDPRNADRLEVIDARYCVSCHTEHKELQTRDMGLTLPDDYCFHCHQDVGEERPSHKDLAFDSCATSGCHNYHDNKALYEDFLVKNAGGHWLSEIASIGQRNGAAVLANRTLPPGHPQFPKQKTEHPDIHAELLVSAHGEAGLSCNACHADEEKGWLERPGIEQCQTCHAYEAETYQQGKHGMRLAQGLTAISPQESFMSFQHAALQQHQSCNSCHQAHKTDPVVAAKESCLGCHADEHSKAFDNSPHGQLFAQFLAGEIEEESAVSCATCHMPRVKQTHRGEKLLRVQHNQNWNLRPNEKMIRPVCMNCHSLTFSIDALADESLIQNNFNGQPSEHVPSVDWAKQRVEQD